MNWLIQHWTASSLGTAFITLAGCLFRRSRKPGSFWLRFKTAWSQVKNTVVIEADLQWIKGALTQSHIDRELERADRLKAETENRQLRQELREARDEIRRLQPGGRRQ